mgnify:CR=1 FL=1
MGSSTIGRRGVRASTAALLAAAALGVAAGCGDDDGTDVRNIDETVTGVGTGTTTGGATSTTGGATTGGATTDTDDPATGTTDDATTEAEDATTEVEAE